MNNNEKKARVFNEILKVIPPGKTGPMSFRKLSKDATVPEPELDAILKELEQEKYLTEYTIDNDRTHINVSEVINNGPILIHELIIRSSLQVMLAKTEDMKPIGFGTGCIIVYKGKKFLVSVAHVTDHEGLTVMLETNLPSDESRTPLKPVGGLCTFDLLKVTKDMDVTKFQELISARDKKKRLDITFAEIKEDIPLLQPAIDFGAFKIAAGSKIYLYMDNIALPENDLEYGFYGKVRHGYRGLYLQMTPTFKHSLKYTSSNEYFHRFIAPEMITDSADYEGCSGAPILDSLGRLVALACGVYVPSKVIAGFSIHKCKELLDYALQAKML